ncbi:28S ribosomal protein S33-like protein, partial [Leptotrombidium deliense]
KSPFETLAMAAFKNVSKYAQRMTRLSCKIFGEYYKPPMPKDIFVEPNIETQIRWESEHYQNVASINRLSLKPFDFNEDKNHLYYPPHPQLRTLMYTLREHGLYRFNEHLDFVEEMKRIRLLRGKKPRVKGGMTGKRAALKK